MEARILHVLVRVERIIKDGGRNGKLALVTFVNGIDKDIRN